MCEDIFGVTTHGEEALGIQWVEARGIVKTSCNTQDSAHNEEMSCPEVNSTASEEPWLKVTASPLEAA